MPETKAKTRGSKLDADERRAIFAQCERFLGGNPPASMRQTLVALAEEADEGEEADAYGEGELIARFEHEIAALLGKEAAVFMPSGTMAQQIALRIWSERSGRSAVAFHPTCHLELHEHKGYERLHGLYAHLVGNPHTLLTLADLQAVAEPIAALLLELPQREIGGQLPSWGALVEQTAWAHEQDAATHMDGARLWESAPFYDRSYAEIAALFDSVYVSFYKGLGGISGAALAGPADVIAEARTWQTRHGGRLRQLYPYVLSARLGLRQRLHRFAHYHQRAVEIAAALSAVPGVSLKPNPPHAHMMHVYLQGDVELMTAASLAIAREERVLLFRNLRPTDLPDWWMFELSVGEGADAISDAEIAGYFTRITGA